jgi:hypothetical protein
MISELSMDHENQKFKEVCFQFLDFFDKKTTRNTIETHLFSLFKTYYSPMVDYTERRKTKRKKN